MSFRLVCWGTYRHIHPKRNVPVYPHAFLWCNNKYLPVSTTTSVPAHRCTRSWPYLFILIQSFWYPLSSTRPRFCCSTFPQTYMFINIPVRFISYFPAYPSQRPFSSSTGVLTHRSTRKYFFPVYHHASLSSDHKDLPVSTTTCVPDHRCTRSWPNLFIFTFILITVKIYPSTFLLFYMSTYVPVHHYICSVYFFFFRHNLCNDLSTHLLG